MADNVNYEVDLNDERLQNVTEQGNDILKESNAAYDSAVAANNKTSAELQGKIEANTNDLVKAQQELSDLAIQSLENDIKNTEKDYIKEQSGAYTDWKKQSNQYGANAEARAAGGMTNTGYTESSQVAMYNQYQNRIATAREAYTRAVTDFKLGIAEAKAANNVAIAEIKANAFAQSLEIAMQFAMQNNTLLTQKAQSAATIKNQNFANYMTVYDSIMQENALAEEVRQFNESHALDERQVKLAEDQFAWQKEQAGGGGGGSSSKGAKVTKSKAAVDKIVKGKIAKDLANDKNVKKTNNTKKSSDPTVDMNSVLALGYGPISEKTLSDLVDQGKVVQYTENGKIKFKKVFNY